MSRIDDRTALTSPALSRDGTRRLDRHRVSADELRALRHAFGQDGVAGHRPAGVPVGPLPGTNELARLLSSAAARPALAPATGTPGDPSMFTTWPWCTVGRLEVGRFHAGVKGKMETHATGVLVGRKLVLTAGHALPWRYLESDEWWVDFFPAVYNTTVSAFGSSAIDGWYGIKDKTPFDGDVGDIIGFDYAVCSLVTPLGDVCGWVGTKSLAESRYDDYVYTSVGYPYDVGNGFVPCVENGLHILDTDDHGEGIELETRRYGANPGWSGGPLWTSIDGDLRVMAVATSPHKDGLDPTRVGHSGGRLMVDIVRYGIDHFGATWTAGWQDLGGAFKSVPAVASWGPNRLDVFGIDVNDAMYHKAWDGSNWVPSNPNWEHLGDEARGAPAAVSWGPNRLDLFAFDPQHAIYHKAWDGSNWVPGNPNWEHLGGAFKTAPTAVSWGPNRLDLFGIDVHDAVYHKAWDGSTWVPVNSKWEPLGGAFNSVPAVTSWGPNRLDVFGIGKNGAIYHKAWTPETGWWPSKDGWEDLGGAFKSTPAVVSWGPNRLDVFGIGMNGAIYHKAWTPETGWWPSKDGWEDLGGAFKRAPAVVSWGPNRLDVFGIGLNDAMYHKAWTPETGWWPSKDGWEDLGGAFKRAPAVASWGPNRLDIVGIGMNDAMYHKAWSAG
jgi:hypothetical protein